MESISDPLTDCHPEPPPIPAAVESERYVLGSMMQDPEAVEAATAGLSVGDFYEPIHQTLFRVLLDLCAEGVTFDTPTVARELERAGVLETIGGQIYLADLLDVAYATANVGYHVAQIHEAAARRAALLLAQDTAARVSSPSADLADVLRAAQDGLADLAAGVLPSAKGRRRRAAPSIAVADFLPFPVAALPPPLNAFVRQAAAAVGCDAVLVALPLLSALAGAVGNARRVALKRGWTEPAVLWTAAVAPSGTLKSPAMDLALKPVRRRQSAAMEDYRTAREEYERAKALHERDMQHWRKSRGGDPPPAPDEPVCPRYSTDNATVEALAALLADNSRGLLLARDELSGWFGSFDQYTNARGADVSHYLSMHRAGTLLVDRKSGTERTLHAKRAAVSITGTIQPGVLRRCIGQEHRENGLLARFLLAMPPTRARHWTNAEVAPNTERDMDAVFDALYALDADADGEPVDLPLSRDAQARWIDFVNEHGREQADLEDEDLAAAWSKLEGAAARLALILHLARAVSDPSTPADAVDLPSVEAGIALAGWFGREAERVYAALGETPDQRTNRALLDLIRQHGGTMTVREITHRSPRLGDTQAVESRLNDLAAAGHGQWQYVPAGPRGGRPSHRFVLADYSPTAITETPEKSRKREVSVLATPEVSPETAPEGNGDDAIAERLLALG